MNDDDVPCHHHRSYRKKNFSNTIADICKVFPLRENNTAKISSTAHDDGNGEWCSLTPSSPFSMDTVLPQKPYSYAEKELFIIKNTCLHDEDRIYPTISLPISRGSNGDF